MGGIYDIIIVLADLWRLDNYSFRKRAIAIYLRDMLGVLPWARDMREI